MLRNVKAHNSRKGNLNVLEIICGPLIAQKHKTKLESVKQKMQHLNHFFWAKMSNPFSVLRVRKTLEWLKSKHAIMVVIYGLTTDSLGRCQIHLCG